MNRYKEIFTGIVIGLMLWIFGCGLLYAWDNQGWRLLNSGTEGQRGNVAMRTSRATWAAKRGIIWGQCGRCGRIVIPGRDSSVWDASIQRHVCKKCVK